MIEGLFVRALAVDPASSFADDLRAIGLDLRHIEDRYDINVWIASLDVATKYVYPELPRDDAWVRLGRRFIEGYFHTFVGGAIAAVLPFMSASRFVERIPWFLRTGLGGATAELDFTGPNSALLTMHGPHLRSPIILVGVLEVCFERLGTKGTFSWKVIGEVDTELTISWT
ncbi:MAG TPA: DUF2378 family protein [Archangium sp.]